MQNSLKTEFSGSTNRSTCLHIHRPFQWLINSNTRAARMRFVSLYVYACRLVGATHLSCDITTEYHGLIQNCTPTNHKPQPIIIARYTIIIINTLLLPDGWYYSVKKIISEKKEKMVFYTLLFFFCHSGEYTNVFDATSIYTILSIDVKQDIETFSEKIKWARTF